MLWKLMQKFIWSRLLLWISKIQGQLFLKVSFITFCKVGGIFFGKTEIWIIRNSRHGSVMEGYNPHELIQGSQFCSGGVWTKKFRLKSKWYFLNLIDKLILDIYCILQSELLFLNACSARFKVGLRYLSLVDL